MNDTQPSATAILASLQQGQLSALELAERYLQRIEEQDQQVGAFLHVDGDRVRSEAKSIDDRRARGESLGRLAGMPVAIKDLLCTQGVPTTCGSKMLAQFRPPYDATVVQKLAAEDAIILGKTNLDEFAMGSSTEHSALQVTRNPWDTSRTPGGSSGGSAACVAAGMSPWSLGTDTGGSIRQPASFCGVVGMKPTYGRVSRYGLVAFASSLDQIGPFGRHVEDVALLAECISGHDPRDSTSARHHVPAWGETVCQPIENLKIGVIRNTDSGGDDPEVATAVETAAATLKSLGARLVDVELPHAAHGVATYYVIAPSEASGNLARYDGMHYGARAEVDESAFTGKESDSTNRLTRTYEASRSAGFGPEVKRRIMLGTYALSAGYYDAYYLKALKVRRLIRDDYRRAFEQVDLLLGPTSPTTAFRLGEKSDDPMAMYLADVYTVLANLAGIPAISLPCGFDSQGLPVGLQLQGPPFEEDKILRAAYMYQQATDWHQRSPA